MTKLYHFTRLLEEEIEDIRKNGLLPLSYDLIARKLRILEQEELARNISVELQDYGLENRLDQICFVACSFENLADQEDVNLLLTKWGGEVLHDLSDEYDFKNEYQKAVSQSKPYEISIDIKNADGLKVYESFNDDPLTEPIIDPTKEYQVKQIIPPTALTIRDLSE